MTSETLNVTSEIRNPKREVHKVHKVRKVGKVWKDYDFLDGQPSFTGIPAPDFFDSQKPSTYRNEYPYVAPTWPLASDPNPSSVPLLDLMDPRLDDPTCFQEIFDQTGFDVAAMFIDAVEQKVLG